MSETGVFRFFGVQEELLRERLADMLASGDVAATLSYADGECVLRAEATPHAMQALREAVESRLGAYLYSTDGSSLAQRVVTLFADKGLTVATAESCTGGLIAAQLTEVAGCSRVLGTGVVSYSWDCKQQLLGVSKETLETDGAVSARTAREMAVGIRRRSGASVGVSVTGEAGPAAAESCPIGTVFVAMADKKRVWVTELHLSGDRASIRRQAAGFALERLRQYAAAYPTVMAGGVRHAAALEHKPSPEMGRFVRAVLPWKGTRRFRIFKWLALGCVLAVTVGSVWLAYSQLLAPASNRDLQEDLAALYWNNTADLTVDDGMNGGYPPEMSPAFRALYDRNRDIAGWMHIPETAVNYPVTYYADGYYATHDFNDQYSAYGQPYFDEHIAADTLRSSRVLTIYGNNTRDEQMFSALLSYRRIAFLREHAYVEMNTLYEAANWEIFAVAVVDARDESFDYTQQSFVSDAAYLTFLQGLQRRSLFTSDAALRATDRALLLVTNAEREFGFTGARLVVAARRQETVAVATPQYAHNSRMLWPAAYSRRTEPPRTTTTAIATTTPGSTTTTTTIGKPSTTESLSTPGSTEPPADASSLGTTTTAAREDPTTTTAGSESTDLSATTGVSVTSTAEAAGSTSAATQPTDTRLEQEGTDDGHLGD